MSDCRCPAHQRQRALDMRNAIDHMENAMMATNALELAQLFETTGDDVIVTLKVKVSELKQIAKALHRLNHIINSDEYVIR